MKIFSPILLTLICFALSACSQNGNVALKDIDVTTQKIGANTYINMNATVAMGNLKFPNVEFPIINPATLDVYGQMALMNNANGTNQIYVSVDYTQSTHLDPSLGTTLPNSRALPTSLGVASGTTMIGIPILTHSRIYIGGDLAKDVFVGAAIAIPAFDGVMNQVMLPLNIFFAYPFSSDVNGYAGLFTGPVAGQNGIAVFVRKSFAPTSAGTTITDTTTRDTSTKGTISIGTTSIGTTSIGTTSIGTTSIDRTVLGTSTTSAPTLKSMKSAQAITFIETNAGAATLDQNAALDESADINTRVNFGANAKSNLKIQSVETPIQPTGGEELSKLSNSSLIKLDRLFKKNAVLKIR